MAEPALRYRIAEEDLIAERALEFVAPGGQRGTLHLRIARPVEHREDGAWSCGLHFEEVEDSVSELWGEDSLQALVHALYMARVVVGMLRNQGFAVTFDGQDNLLLPDFVLPGILDV